MPDAASGCIASGFAAMRIFISELRCARPCRYLVAAWLALACAAGSLPALAAAWGHGSGFGQGPGAGSGMGHGGGFGHGHPGDGQGQPFPRHGGHDGHGHEGHEGHDGHRGHGAVIIVPPLLAAPYYAYPWPEAMPPAPMGFIGQDEYGNTISYWYWCDSPAGYYPTIQNCLSGWRAVQPGTY
jgi:hypothetical protein